MKPQFVSENKLLVCWFFLENIKNTLLPVLFFIKQANTDVRVFSFKVLAMV